MIRQFLRSLPILLLLSFGVVARPALAADENARIERFEEVDLANLSESQKQEVLKQFPALKNRAPNPAEADQLLRYLVLQMGFESATLFETQRPAQVILRVQNKDKLAKLDFRGLDAISESEARLIMGVSEKMGWDQEAIVDGAQRLKNTYQERGYYNVQVELEFEKPGDNNNTARVLVREGPVTRIDRFEVTCPNPELNKSLTNYLRRYRKEPLTDSVLSEIRTGVRGFLSENNYFRSDIDEPRIELSDSDAKATIHFSVNQGEQFSFEFIGNQRMNATELKNSLNLDTFFSSNPVLAPEFANKIRDYYLAHGYARVEVSGRESEGTRPFLRRIEITVNEGPRVEITKWEVNGRLTQMPKKYVEFIKDHSGKMLPRNWYVRDEIETGIKNLIVDRQNNGFLQAKMISLRTIYNSKKDKITVILNFDEGPLTIVQKVTFEGADAFPAAELTPLVGLVPNEALRLNELELGITRLRDFYRNNGYLEMTIVNEKEDLVRYNEDNTLAQVHFRIYEGPQVRVASIQIEGNVLTKDYVILKELEFGPGDILTPAKIDESVSRLQKLGHFNSVDIRTLEEHTQVANRTVIVRVTDRDPGLFNMGLGATNERGVTVRGFLGIAYRNIGGSGRAVSARIDGNYNLTEIRYLERKVSLGYLEPYIFDTRTRGRLNYTQAISVTNYSPVLLSEVRQTTTTLEQDITSNVLVSWDVLSLARYKDFSRDDDPTYPEQTLDIGSTALTFDVDFRDHPFNPSKGTFTRLTSEYGSPEIGSNRFVKYFRSIASFTHYWGMAPGWVWANSLRLGYLKNLLPPDEGYVPYDKKGFSLGGQSTIRGFAPGEAFPSFFEFGTDRFNLTTESTMQLIKSELRIPIWGNIGTAIFYDGGQVTVKDMDLRNPWRHAVGIAARYITPVGAASLEYGYKLNPQAQRNESMAALHFSIGTF